MEKLYNPHFLFNRKQLLEIGSIIFSNISLFSWLTQCYAIGMLLSSLFHVYGDFPSQIRNYLLRNSMRHTGLAQRDVCSRVLSSFSGSLAILLLGSVPCAFNSRSMNSLFVALLTQIVITNSPLA